MAGTWIPVPQDSPFPVENLPLGIGHRPGESARAFVALGDAALDLAAVAGLGLLDGTGVPDGAFAEADLNRYLSAGRSAWRAVRDRLTDLLTDPKAAERLRPNVADRDRLAMTVPVRVGDYVDFYSSLHHATNLGRLLRPDGEPLHPNWRRLPVGYHGRSAGIVASGSAVTRPTGQRLEDGEVVVGPSRALDLELEVGFVAGPANSPAAPIRTADAADHIGGFCLVNDWSARDIQAFEYVPLGPFLGKSFATSMSPWLVSLDALAPHRVPPPVQDPPVADYLRADEPWGLDLHLEVLLQTAAMRDRGRDPAVVSRVGFADMYWTPAQQLAHVTVNGAVVRPGDLFASGTVSGAVPGSEGSLIEATSAGAAPLELPGGETRGYLENGDTVILRGWAGGEGAPRIGLGEVTGTVAPAREEV